ncbi:hypothetical protein ACFUIY_12175 [Streptomyces griseorubiginosus]|uniref:hypothetical protein n=1 Tax=Streptomyces griseorubiginosus TaxID=67304 RepID=UPI00362E4C62
MTVRSGPGSGCSTVGSLPNGVVVEVECWTCGTPVNGCTVRTRLHGGSRYVGDHCLGTGRVQSVLRQC